MNCLLLLLCLPLVQDDLIEKLEDDDPAVRAKAADELASMGEKALAAVRAALAKGPAADLKSALSDVESRIVAVRIDAEVAKNLEKLPQTWGTGWYHAKTPREEAAFRFTLEFRENRIVAKLTPSGEESLEFECRRDPRLTPLSFKLADKSVAFEGRKIISQGEDSGKQLPERALLSPEILVTLLPFEKGLKVPVTAIPLILVPILFDPDLTSEPLEYRGAEKLEGKEVHTYTLAITASQGGRQSRVTATYWVGAERTLLKAEYVMERRGRKETVTLTQIDEARAKEVEAAALVPKNERNASATLKQWASIQVTIRTSDSDQNGAADYWVADVSGAYRITAGGQQIRMCEVSMAMADAAPLPAGVTKFARDEDKVDLGASLCDKPTPKAGYYFKAIPKYRDGADERAYDPGNGRNPDRFALCAFPAEHGRTGRLTFMMSEEYTMWKKDTGGKAVDVWPADPAKDGWTKME
ncbi:MAG TPA: DUF2950 family protein [Planctomycetota bacterium]|nr:DUF2950 family protein [Planctomycetota bacterium]